MAGKRQHYVPRLLQRGFVANVPGDAERTWLHRPGVAACLVGIGDVGTEDWFYSRRGTPGELTLDDVITAFENDLGRDVAPLRAAPPGMEIEAQRAAHITVHLVMRTAHLRRTIADAIHRIIGEVKAVFTDPVRLRATLGFDSPLPTLPVAEVIGNLAQTLVPAGFPAAFSERLLAFLVRERSEELIGQAVGTLEHRAFNRTHILRR